jgi:hypothetical protein
MKSAVMKERNSVLIFHLKDKKKRALALFLLLYVYNWKLKDADIFVILESTLAEFERPEYN